LSGKWTGDYRPGITRLLDPCDTVTIVEATFNQDGSQVVGRLVTQRRTMLGEVTLHGEVRQNALLASFTNDQLNWTVASPIVARESGSRRANGLTLTFNFPCSGSQIVLARSDAETR
jgi:hypothetical protein